MFNNLSYLLLAFYILYSYGYVFVALATVLNEKKSEDMSGVEAAAYLLTFLASPIFCPMFAGAKEAGK